MAGAKGVWAAFDAGDAAAFEAALRACPGANAILVNCANPLPCQAARLGRREILAAALRADPWGATAADPELRTPLHHAALAGDLAAVRLVLELAPERARPEMLIRQQDAGRMTVLHAAVLSGNEPLVEFLLEQGGGAGVDMPSKSGLLPVHFACSKGLARAVAAMAHLESGAAAIAKLSGSSATLLHRATVEGHLAVVKALLASGLCDPNLQDEDGSTALHLACALEFIEIVEVLEAVTDHEIADGQGKRARDWCVAGDGDEADACIRRAPAPEPEPEPTSPRPGHLVSASIFVSRTGEASLTIRALRHSPPGPEPTSPRPGPLVSASIFVSRTGEASLTIRALRHSPS